MQVTGVAKGSQVTDGISMHAPGDKFTSSRSFLMRFLVRSWEYRRPRSGSVCALSAASSTSSLASCCSPRPRLGLLDVAGGVPLAGAALIFWTVYGLQQDSVHRVHELEQSRAHVVDDTAAQVAPDRAGPARRGAGADGRRRNEAGSGQGEARGAIDGTAQADLERALELVDAAHRGAKEAIVELRELARGIHPLSPRPGPRHRAQYSGRAQRHSRRAGHRPARAALGRDRDHRLLLRGRADHQRSQAQRRPAGHAGGGEQRRACCGCGSATTAAAAPASRPAAAWPGWPSGSGPWMAGCSSPARATVLPWSPSSYRPTPDSRTGVPMRIVIAEDSAVVRAGLAEILADRGHEVVAAVGNADDLLAAVDRAPAGRHRGGRADAARLHRRGPARRDHHPPRPPEDRGAGVLPVHRDPLHGRPARRGLRRRRGGRRLPAQGPGRRRR